MRDKPVIYYMHAPGEKTKGPYEDSENRRRFMAITSALRTLPGVQLRVLGEGMWHFPPNGRGGALSKELGRAALLIIDVSEPAFRVDAAIVIANTTESPVLFIGYGNSDETITRLHEAAIAYQDRRTIMPTASGFATYETSEQVVEAAAMALLPGEPSDF